MEAECKSVVLGATGELASLVSFVADFVFSGVTCIEFFPAGTLGTAGCPGTATFCTVVRHGQVCMLLATSLRYFTSFQK